MARFSVRTKLLTGAAVVAALGFAGASWVSANQQPAAPAASAPVAAPAPAPASAAQTPGGKRASGAAPAALEKPLWKELSAPQKRALEPLNSEWDKLEGVRKQKWLEIANRFASMNPDEQMRVHERMRDWVKLTPQQRRMVRENYARTQKITPGQKSAQWEQYQQLSEDQKKVLADKASQKKQVANPPTPAQSKIQTVPPIKSGKPQQAQPVPAAPATPPPNAAAAAPAGPLAAPPAGAAAPTQAVGAAAPAATAAPAAVPAPATAAVPLNATPASPAAPPNVK